MQELQDDDPMRIGPYRLTARLGAGGMGKVFLGRSPGGRLVAVKVIRDELAGDADFRARFRHEVTGARLVSGFFTAPVVDADLDGPVPWLVTGYVPGPSLAAAVTAHGPLPVESVLVLAAALAEGLGAIHAAGVVHRDMKPANVLLAADGPRIIDFGIARATESTALTRTGWAMGSPGFMSPEQATGDGIGPASDVFSLGAVLAFAATGSGPFGSGAADALLYRIVHEAPDLDGLPEAVRGVVGRCLAKDPRQRPTAGRLLDELGGADLTAEWLPAEVVREFAAVMPGQPALPGATALPGVSSPAGATARLNAGEPVITSAPPDPRPDPAPSLPARDYDLRDDVPLSRPERAGSPPARLEHEALVKTLTFSADSAWLATVAGKTVRLWDTALLVTTLPHAHQVTGAEFSLDATRLATRTAGPAFGSRHQVALWDTATGTETARLPHRAQVIAAGFSPDGTRLATATVTDTAARLWDPLSGEEIARLGHGGRVSRLIFSPHGARIVLLGASGNEGSVWDTMTGREVGWIRHEHWIKAVAFSPDGTRLVSFSEEGATLLWDAVSGQERPWNTGTSEWDEATGRELKWTERMPRWNAAFSPDGARLATAGAGGTIRLWDPATGDELARMRHDSTLLLVYSPDGSWLATASAEGTIKLWDSAGGSERAQLRHAGVIAMAALRLDGTRLATVGGEDKMVKIWDPVSGQETSRMPRGKTRMFSPDGTVLATGGDRVTRLLDTATGRQLAAIEHDDLVRGRTFSPDGSQLAIRAGKAAYRWAM